MDLIHLHTRICGGLLVRACLIVCSAIVGLELAEECDCAGLHDLWVVVRRRRRVRQPEQMLNDGVWVIVVVVQHDGKALLSQFGLPRRYGAVCSGCVGTPSGSALGVMAGQEGLTGVCRER